MDYDLDSGTEAEALEDSGLTEIADEDFKDEEWERAFKNNIHIMRDGTEIKISKMSDSHLKNTIRYSAQRMRDKDYNANYWRGHHKLFLAEKAKRTPTPKKEG